MWPSVTRYWLGFTIVLEVTINERFPSTIQIWSDPGGSYNRLSWGAHQYWIASPFCPPKPEAPAMRNKDVTIESGGAMMPPSMCIQQSAWKPIIFAFLCCWLPSKLRKPCKPVATSFQPVWTDFTLKRKSRLRKLAKSMSGINADHRANPGSEEQRDPDDLSIWIANSVLVTVRSSKKNGLWKPPLGKPSETESTPSFSHLVARMISPLRLSLKQGTAFCRSEKNQNATSLLTLSALYRKQTHLQRVKSWPFSKAALLLTEPFPLFKVFCHFTLLCYFQISNILIASSPKYFQFITSIRSIFLWSTNTLKGPIILRTRSK